MAVPKRKTSVSKRNQRRSHHRVPKVNIVEDKKTGYLCKAQDKKDLMRCVEDFLLLHHDDRALMGRLGREKMVKSYDDTIIKQAYRNLLESSHILHNKNPF